MVRIVPRKMRYKFLTSRPRLYLKSLSSEVSSEVYLSHLRGIISSNGDTPRRPEWRSFTLVLVNIRYLRKKRCDPADETSAKERAPRRKAQ